MPAFHDSGYRLQWSQKYVFFYFQDLHS